MSKHNYSQYSNKKNDNRKAGVVVAQAAENNKSSAVNTNHVPPATAPKAKTEFVEPVIDPVIKLVQETVDTVSLPETVTGTVANCTKLNVRANPSTTAEIVCVLDAKSEIEIDVAKSTNEWFKVYTAIGSEGYCMRQFVNATL